MLHPLANGIGGMSLVASIHQQTWETNEIFGSVKFKTLFGKEQLVGNSPIAMGYAALDSSGILDMHTHDDAEFYFCTRGSANIVIDGTSYAVASGSVIFIPGKAPHVVYAGADGFEFLYGFPGQLVFDEVNYEFMDENSTQVA